MCVRVCVLGKVCSRLETNTISTLRWGNTSLTKPRFSNRQLSYCLVSGMKSSADIRPFSRTRSDCKGTSDLKARVNLSQSLWLVSVIGGTGLSGRFNCFSMKQTHFLSWIGWPVRCPCNNARLTNIDSDSNVYIYGEVVFHWDDNSYRSLLYL